MTVPIEQSRVVVGAHSDGESFRSKIISSLNLTLSPDARARQEGEQFLDSCSSVPGFGVCLAGIGLDVGSNIGQRQLALVFLRRLVKSSWSSEQIDKDRIRRMLPDGLREDNSQMQTATGLVIAEICKWENVVLDWPDLMPGLVNVIQANADAVFIRGALRLLCLMVEDLDQVHVIELARLVLPYILSSCIADGHVTGEYWGAQHQALTILHSTIDASEMMYKSSDEAQNLIKNSIVSWFDVCCAVLDQTCGAIRDSQSWPCLYMGLQCATRLVPLSGKLPDMSPCHRLLASIWTCNQTICMLYSDYVRSDGVVPQHRSDNGTETNLTDISCQLLEALTTILTYKRLKKACEPSLRSILNDTILNYMMITPDEAEEWLEDCNAYLSSGDEFWGSRSSGGLLIESIVESYGHTGVRALEESTSQTVEAVEKAVNAQDVIFWRIMEAALLSLSNVSDLLIDNKQGDVVLKKEGSCMNPNHMLHWLLNNANYSSMGNPLLLARIFSYAGKYAKVLSSETRGMVLQCLGTCITAEGISPALYGGIFQALSPLVKYSSSTEIQHVSSHFMRYLCDMLKSATDDTMHFVLENIQELVRKEPSCVTSWAGTIIPIAMRAWIDNYNDPLLGEDAFVLLQSLSRCPGGLEHMASTAIPTIQAILQSDPCPTLLVSSCFDLLVEITSPALPQEAKIIFVEFAPGALQLLQSTQDEDIIASVSAFLRTSLQLGKAEAFSWFSPSPDTSISTFVQIIHFLLRPETPDRGARYVGGIILALIDAASLEALGQDTLVTILRMLGTKLCVAEEPSLVQSLIGVLATLIRIDSSAFITILAGFQDKDLSLQAIMEKWIERHIEIRTPYDIKRSIVGLATILTCSNPAIDQVIVKGCRTDTSSSIRTRSKAMTLKEEWSMVPLRSKIALLLLDSYIEADTQGLENAEDEEEWIEDDDEEDDYIEGDEDDYHSYSMYGEFLGDDDDDIDFLLADIDYLERARRENDQLTHMSVLQYIPSILKGFQACPELFRQFCDMCTPVQTQYLQRVLQS